MPDKKRTGRLDWEDVRYFVALARNGTLSATARGLRVNHDRGAPYREPGTLLDHVGQGAAVRSMTGPENRDS
jgi:hypothetical protein